MPNINSEILDSHIRHALYLQRYSSSVANDILKILIKSESAAKEIFDQRIGKILELGFDSGPKASERTARLISELGAEIEQLRSELAFAELSKHLTNELGEFSGYESEWLLSSLGQATNQALSATPFNIAFEGVAAAQVFAAATSKPFTISPGKMAKTLGDYLSGMAEAERQRIEDAVTTGVVNGLTNRDIVRSVWGTIEQRKSSAGNSAVITTRRGAEMLVRTAINHIGTVARDSIYKQNSDVIKEVEWVSTLDSRTTPICQGRDGNTYPIDSGPRPPAHANCRSLVVPKLKTYRELGIDIDEPEKSTRAYLAIPAKMNVTQYRRKLKKEGLTKSQQDQIIRSLSGQTDDPTFGAFLSRQTKEFQEAVLGKKRTELYRKGELDLKDLISPKGQYYTLEELRKLQPDAFEKVGME